MLNRHILVHYLGIDQLKSEKELNKQVTLKKLDVIENFDLKIIDYGVILHPGSYLRELWNVMDMLVVSCAISSFTMDML